MALQFLNDGYFAGKVGIGTASPENLLHIKAADGVTGVLKIEGGKNIVTSANEINSQLDFGSNDGSVNNTGNVGGRISSITENTNGALVGMAFSTFQQSRAIDLQEAMRITNAGNIGIGTTSPNARLDVIGVGLSSLFRVSNTDADATTKYGTFMGRHYTNSEENITGMLLTSSSSVTGGAVSIGGGITSANAVNEIKFYTAANNTTLNGSERMRINSSGNVGIGTTTPSKALHVSDSNDAPFRVESTDSTTGIQFKDPDGNNNIYYVGNGDYFYTSANVGIGTTSPQSKLQVAGGIQMADDTDTASAAKVGTMRYRTGTEYVEVTGTEMVTNGDFATDTDWSKNSGVTISGGTMNFTSTPGHYGSQNINFTNGAKYKINFEITAETSGILTVFLGAGNNVGSISGVGKKEIIATGNSSLDTKVYFGNNFTGSIDNVSVIEVTAEDASYADMCMQTGSSTYEWVNIVRNTY